MADIFISYTSADSDWAKWIAKELEALGHTPHVHEWEIAGGGDIAAWMEERHHNADHILCVVSEAYLKAPYSSWERRAAQWTATTKRPNFALPVFIEACDAPTLLASVKRCDLHGLSEDEARARLAAFLEPAAKATGPASFPGAMSAEKTSRPPVSPPVTFPGKASAISNIPIGVPLHFLGRDKDTAAIDAALKTRNGRVAITALHGLRGVGKTTLAAAYAERHRDDYRATWWIRAQESSTMRADLVGLGVQLGWIAPDEKEEPALAVVMAKLCDEGDGVLLVYDNANNASELRPYMPRTGAAQAIVTSNAPDWRSIGAPVEIEVWPKEVGADYLMARTGRDQERGTALALSETLGGLPLAHEQAAAYCERLGISLAEYRKRFEATPVKLLDAEKDAPSEYHDRLTVAKTFALAIEEAAKFHPAAESLIVHAALLAPAPIPLFLFSEAREIFGEPLASALRDDGLDEAVSTLRAFALIGRETIADERDPSITTDSIRLHRLVRQVAAARREGTALEEVRRALFKALAMVYPVGVFVFNNPEAWPRARRLNALALALADNDVVVPEGAEEPAADLFNALDSYYHGALADYATARPLSERALAIREKLYGPEHPFTAASLDSLGRLLKDQGDFAGARPIYERALVIREKVLGADHALVAASLNNLARLLHDQGDLIAAQRLLQRALAIDEKVYGPDHPEVALALNNLAGSLRDQGDLTGARLLIERSLAIREKALHSEHPAIAIILNNLGSLLVSQGELDSAQRYLERALAINEKMLGPDHLNTAISFNNFGRLRRAQGDVVGSQFYFERELAINERTLGPMHPVTRDSARFVANAFDALGRTDEAMTSPMDYQQIITIEPGKRGGRPCIRHMRIAVADVLGWLADGRTHEQILGDFPELTEDDIRACLAWAADRERRSVTAST